MRTSVISDVHGNQRALNADLADLPARDVDLTVNLADILSGVLQPKETADRLIPLDLPTVRGNHERQVLTDSPDKMGLADRLARDAMTAELGLVRILALAVGDFQGRPRIPWLAHR